MLYGTLPEQYTQYEVYALVQHVDGGKRDLYQKIGGIAWPSRQGAQEFQKAYEKMNPWSKGKTVILEKHTTFTNLTDYDKEKYAHDTGSRRHIPAQRGLQREGDNYGRQN